MTKRITIQAEVLKEADIDLIVTPDVSLHMIAEGRTLVKAPMGHYHFKKATIFKAPGQMGGVFQENLDE